MLKMVLQVSSIVFVIVGLAMAQDGVWETDYVTFDASGNGTGYQTASVAAVDSNRFVALVTETPESPILENLFDPPGNYLVGYWDADSGVGRVNAPINGSPATPTYGGTGQFTDWEAGLDKVTLKGAWQMASDNQNRVYVANNDEAHNILVFELTADGVVSTDARMETGAENIFGVEVDGAGNVYVIDYQGDDVKTDEVKVYAGIDAPGTTWTGFGGHNDTPIATIDLPPGTYQGITASDDGTAIYVSATSEQMVWKYAGDPENGYAKDEDFMFTITEDDTISNGGNGGTPSVLGLGYLNDPPMVFAAVDTFIWIGGTQGYPYARIYAIDAKWGTALDTIDVAAWNLEQTGDYSSGSNNGRAGGFGSIADVDVEPGQKALYSQTYYGWAAEKWIFTGDLNDIVGAVELTNAQVPNGFALKQNYPNPFNPSTTIEFDLSRGQFASLVIYNTLGQEVATLLNGELTAGSYKVDFNAGQLPSGVYFYKLSTSDFTSVKKMVLTK
jgi:hypothetical protein